MDATVPAHERRGPGRRPAFDRQEALRHAMRLFWERGYEGAKFDELCTAMGISASSFQHAFGGKASLYEEATKLYLEEKANWFTEVLAGDDDTRGVFQRLIAHTADAFTRGDQPPGCMVLTAALSAIAGDPIRDMMVAQRALSERLMRERLETGIAAGDLPADTDAAALAAYFSTVSRGMAVQARDGATKDQLLKIAQLAMQAWPAKPPPP